MARTLYRADLMLAVGTGNPPAALLASAAPFTVWSARTGGAPNTPT